MPCINMMTGQPIAGVGDRGTCVAYGGDWMEEPSLMQPTDTDDFGNPLRTDFEGNTNFGLLRDRAVNKFNQKEFDKPFRGEVSRTGTSQPMMIQTENGLRPMTIEEINESRSYNTEQQFGVNDAASIARAKTYQGPMTDRWKLSESDMNSAYPNRGTPGFNPTQYPSLMTGVDADPQGALLWGDGSGYRANLARGPMTDRWAAKPGDYRIGRSYSMGEGDWRDPVGGTEYNYTDTDFAGNPLDTNFEGNVLPASDRAIIRGMNQGTGTSGIAPGSADQLFERANIIKQTDTEFMKDKKDSMGLLGALPSPEVQLSGWIEEDVPVDTGKGDGDDKGTGTGTGTGTGDVTGSQVQAMGKSGEIPDSIWDNMKTKEYWLKGIKGGAGGWDNRMFRMGELMSHYGTPLSKRGDSPTKRWTTTAKDSSVATKSANTAQAKMQKQKMDYLMKMATVNPKYLATAIQEFLPKGLDDTWFFGLKASEKEGLAMDIALRAQQAMQRAASEGKQLPYEVAMKIAAKKLVEQRNPKPKKKSKTN